MNRLTGYFFLLLGVLVTAACEKDEDKIYLNSIEPGELIASESSIVLTQELSSSIVLSLAWSTDDLYVSDTSVSVPDGLLTMTLQASSDSEFASNVVETTQTSYSTAYTGSELNSLAQSVGLTPGVASNIYFRLAAATGNNMTPVYTNTVAVSVTSYEIDMTLLYVLNTSLETTGTTLYSPDSDGHYEGFMGATSWYNCYFQEGNGTVWGASPIDGNPFTLSSDDDMWNLWFPGQGGCYYVEADVNELYWTALYIPTLTVSGDIEGEMTYNRPTNQWTLVFNATSTGTVNIQVVGTGSLYNSSTATDDDAAIATSVALVTGSTGLELSEQASDISVSIPATGECTLTIDLSDPTQCTASVTSGSTVVEEVSEFVYLPGIDDLISGSWTFDNYLRLYDEDNRSYAGAANVNSEWGYQVAIEVDNWSDYYALDEGDAYSGTLLYQGSNLPAPDPGLYFINVSLGNLTYALTAVETVYYSGFNDDWSLTPMAETETTGVYSATVEITGETPWGFQIVLDEDWSISLGGGDGILLYQGSSSVQNVSFSETSGTFLLTVDLIKGTYSIEAQ